MRGALGRAAAELFRGLWEAMDGTGLTACVGLYGIRGRCQQRAWELEGLRQWASEAESVGGNGASVFGAHECHVPGLSSLEAVTDAGEAGPKLSKVRWAGWCCPFGCSCASEMAHRWM
jgi:hypothetical protein